METLVTQSTHKYTRGTEEITIGKFLQHIHEILRSKTTVRDIKVYFYTLVLLLLSEATGIHFY